MGTVARNRGTTAIIADQVMGQGREFLGKRGLDVGLVDAIGDLEDALAYAKANRTLAARKPANFGASATASVAQASAMNDNAATSNPTGTTMILTPEQLAAVAAGASVEEVTGKAATPTPEEQAAADAAAQAEAQAVADATAAAAESSAEVDALKAQLAEAQAATDAAVAETQALAAKLEATEANLAAVTPVLQASVKNLHIALGKKVDTSAMSVSELVAEHDSAKAAVVDKFKVGGVARSTASTETAKVVPLIAPRDAAAAKTMFNIKR